MYPKSLVPDAMAFKFFRSAARCNMMASTTPHITIYEKSLG